MNKTNKILISGFSGAGKSSFLRVIKNNSPYKDWVFEDLDELLAVGHNLGHVSELIAKVGWTTFRQKERAAIDSWLKEDFKGVLALGGGATTKLLLENYLPSKKVNFLHLYAPFEDCWKRLNLSSAQSRPLVSEGKEKMREIFLEREKILNLIPWKIENLNGIDQSSLANEFWRTIS